MGINESLESQNVTEKNPSILSLDEIEEIEKLTLRWIFQAVYDFGMEAHEIFLKSPDSVKDIAEDITRELLDRLSGFNVQQRVYGTVDYKKARYVILPEQTVRQTLFIDSKAEKENRSATIQMSQTSMWVRQRRSDDEVNEKGFLPEISEYGGKPYLTTTCLIHFKEPLIKCTIGRMAALCPRSTLTYLHDKLRVSLRDALPCIPLSHLIRGSSSITMIIKAFII